MTRLFRQEEDGRLQEVDTNERLAGIYDAILIAENEGDGRYVYDYQNGQYQELNVASGKTQTFEHDAMKEGNPARVFDESQMQDEVSGSISRTGGIIFPEDGTIGRPLDANVPAVEEF